MKIKIGNYSQDIDRDLINFFYKCVFYEREEFEYTRPISWFQRYKPYGSPIIKIAYHKNDIVGTIGILPTIAVINKKIVNGGYFVDNCVSPNYQKDYARIMTELLDEIQIEAKKNNMDFIAGWDYLKNYKLHGELYKNFNFIPKLDVNWFIAGLDYKSVSPKKWRGKNRLYWATVLVLLKPYNYIKLKSCPNAIDEIKIRLIDKSELGKIADFFNNNRENITFYNYYTKKTLEKNWNSIGLRGIVAENKNTIVSVLTFTIATWTGLMYGYPYENDWEEFRTITPDEFIVDKKWIKTKLPTIMLRNILEFDKRFKINTRSLGVVASIFDRNLLWKNKTYKKAGFLEAKADYGVFLIKSLNDKKINNKNCWSIPSRAIIAPLPNWIN
jgi:hypothetical protein